MPVKTIKTQFTLSDSTLEFLMKRTEGAYMRERYGDAQWSSIIKFLHRQDLTTAEIELILCSKHMRWSYDQRDRPTRIEFERYFREHADYFTQEALYRLWSGRR